MLSRMCGLAGWPEGGDDDHGIVDHEGKNVIPDLSRMLRSRPWWLAAATARSRGSRYGAEECGYLGERSFRGAREGVHHGALAIVVR
jgi:hypothetical protein